MTNSKSSESPIARLILFMVCLALAGSFIAGIHYFAIDLPEQNGVSAPENRENFGCKPGCIDTRQECLDSCSPDTCDQCLSVPPACRCND